MDGVMSRARVIGVVAGLVVASLLLAFVMCVTADRVKMRNWLSPERFARRAVEKLRSPLQLSEKQREEMYQILKTHKQEVNAVTSEILDQYEQLLGSLGSASEQDLRGRVTAINALLGKRNDVLLANLLAIRRSLSPEQQKRFGEQMQERIRALKKRLARFTEPK